MNVLILGAGKMGSYLASLLSKEEHSVILADQDASTLEGLEKGLDVATARFSASDWRILEDLMGSASDFFIAMTGDDATNLAACTLAKNLGYKTTICRIKETGYLNRSLLDFSRLFYVDHFIAADVLSSQQLLQTMLSPGEKLHEQFAHGSIHMKTITIPKNWPHTKTAIKHLRLPEELIIGLILRNLSGKPTIIFPHGQDCLMPEDQITVIGEASCMLHLEKVFSLPKKRFKKVVMIGGSDIAVHLAISLQNLGLEVKIVEKNEERCAHLAQVLPKATIMHHDGSDLPFLIAEQVEQADAFVATTHRDESNLYIASMGQKAGAPYVISLISDLSVASLFQERGMRYALSGKINMANQILAIIHGKNILSISSVVDDHARVVELKVSSDSGLIGVPLEDLAAYLPKDLLICIIESKGKVMIGKGSCILSAGDTVILITSPRTVHELEHLF